MPERGEPIRLSDVAERAGVSLATVSRSLSGAAGVSDVVASRVRGVAAAMGYVANPHARSLAGGGSTSLGLVVSDVGDPYFSEIAKGVIEIAGVAGRIVQICHAASEESLVAQIRLLRAERVGGLIIAGSGHDDPAQDAPSRTELEAFRLAGGRLAVIGRRHGDADAVLPDNVAGGRSLGRHLASIGHTKVAAVAGPAGLSVVTDRLRGLRESLGDRLVSVSYQAFSRSGGGEGAAALLATGLEATAVVALNDLMALGVLATFREAGITVPGRISVAGFDDIAVASDVAPGLTTVRLPLAEIGAEAARLVLGEPAASPGGGATSHRLVVRGSTAAP